MVQYIFKKIFNGDTDIEKAEEDQKQYKSNLNEITIGNPKNRSNDQINQNIKY